MTLLIGIHFLICVFLVFVILLQPGKGDGGIGFGAASSSQSIFGSRGAGNFLTKTTTACAVLFLVTSFFLTRSRMREFNTSVIKAESVKESPKTDTAATPAGATGTTGAATGAAAAVPATSTGTAQAPAKAEAPKK